MNTECKFASTEVLTNFYNSWQFSVGNHGSQPTKCSVGMFFRMGDAARFDSRAFDHNRSIN